MKQQKRPRPAEAARAKPTWVVNVNGVLLTRYPEENEMTKPTSFEEFVSNKRKRPVEVCFKCGKHKEIYTHLNGEEDKPLCNTCNMQLRRNSPRAIQVKLLKPDFALALTWRTINFPTSNQKVVGNTTMNLQKFDDGWKIVASHSSTNEM